MWSINKEHSSCVATLEWDLLTLFPFEWDEREILGITFNNLVV